MYVHCLATVPCHDEQLFQVGVDTFSTFWAQLKLLHDDDDDLATTIIALLFQIFARNMHRAKK